jgi:malate synthase
VTDYVDRACLKISGNLAALVENEIAPGTGIDAAQAWAGFAQLIAELAPENLRLLAERDRLQDEIDIWHLAHPGIPNPQVYVSFLESIGYLVPEDAEDFSIATSGVDPEIATTAGPQLVVPVMNARFALNAANARWGIQSRCFITTAAEPRRRYKQTKG